MASARWGGRSCRKTKQRGDYVTPRSILSKLTNSMLADAFLSDVKVPTDYALREDYLDLAIVSERMLEGRYKDIPEMFAGDMRKIWYDALSYFPARSLIHEYAKCLQQDFERLWSEFEVNHDPERKLALRIDKLEHMLEDAKARLDRQERTTYKALSGATITRLKIAIERLSREDSQKVAELLRDYVDGTINDHPVFNLTHMLLRDYQNLKEFLSEHKSTGGPVALPSPHWFVVSPDEFPPELQHSDDSEDSSESCPHSSDSEMQEEQRIIVSALP